ncbi:IS66 family transposase [Shimia sp. MMG029]|uniref:IS66 family transposase n=1 Tax=Shimia sp. MMG029 TaxID=3021978 RepID=UPI003F8E5769
MSRASTVGRGYYLSPTRKGEHPRKHLRSSAAILQADAYSGFTVFYVTRADGSAQIR